MRTGIKTFYKKLGSKIRYPVPILNHKRPGVFPEQGLPIIKNRLRAYSLTNFLKEEKIEGKLGTLYCKPHPIAIEVWEQLLEYNPNHLGNWSIKGIKGIQGTRAIERDLVWAMVKLLGGERKDWEGYMTTGGTESNLFCSWVGRKYLEQYARKSEICLLRTSLTHYSLIKSSDILGLNTQLVNLDSLSWGMDPEDLEKVVIRLKRRSFKAFLLPLTLGYTQTGTNDDFEALLNKTKILESKLKVKFFVWIDAALSGLVLPFVEKNFKPLANKSLGAFILDFHKFGFSPVGSGMVIYRGDLRQLIEKEIPYLDEKDNTLSGSRSGIAAVASWFVINSLGKKGFRRVIASCLKRKERFLNIVSNLGLKVEVITDKNSINLGLISKTKTPFSRKIKEKYGLVGGRTKIKFSSLGQTDLTIFKIYLMPHIKDELLDEFERDLKEEI